MDLPDITKVNTNVFDADQWFKDSKVNIQDQTLTANLKDLVKLTENKLDNQRSFEQDQQGYMFFVWQMKTLLMNTFRVSKFFYLKPAGLFTENFQKRLFHVFIINQMAFALIWTNVESELTKNCSYPYQNTMDTYKSQDPKYPELNLKRRINQTYNQSINQMQCEKGPFFMLMLYATILFCLYSWWNINLRLRFSQSQDANYYLLYATKLRQLENYSILFLMFSTQQYPMYVDQQFRQAIWEVMMVYNMILPIIENDYSTIIKQQTNDSSVNDNEIEDLIEDGNVEYRIEQPKMINMINKMKNYMNFIQFKDPSQIAILIQCLISLSEIALITQRTLANDYSIIFKLQVFLQLCQQISLEMNITHGLVYQSEMKHLMPNITRLYSVTGYLAMLSIIFNSYGVIPFYNNRNMSQQYFEKDEIRTDSMMKDINKIIDSKSHHEVFPQNESIVGKTSSEQTKWFQQTETKNKSSNSRSSIKSSATSNLFWNSSQHPEINGNSKFDLSGKTSQYYSSSNSSQNNNVTSMGHTTMNQPASSWG